VADWVMLLRPWGMVALLLEDYQALACAIITWFHPGNH